MTPVSVSRIESPVTPKSSISDQGPSTSQGLRRPLRSTKSLGNLKLSLFSSPKPAEIQETSCSSSENSFSPFSPPQKTFSSEEYLNLIPINPSGSSEVTDVTESKENQSPEEPKEASPATGTPKRPRRRALSPDSPEEQSPFQITSRLFDDDSMSPGAPGAPGLSNPSGTRDLVVLETPRAPRKSRASLRPEGTKRKLSSSPISSRGLFRSKSLRTPGTSSSTESPGQSQETSRTPGTPESTVSLGTPTDLRTLRTPESTSGTQGALGSAGIFGTPKSSRTPRTCRTPNTPSTPQTPNNLTFSDTIGRHLPTRTIKIPADWIREHEEQDEQPLEEKDDDCNNGSCSPDGPTTPLTTKRERSSKRENTVRPPILMAAPSKRKSSIGARDLKARSINSDGTTTPIASPLYDRSKKSTYLEQSFNLVEILGKGSFGEVFLARSQENQEEYAVKVSVRLVRQSSSVKYREVLALMSLPAHPNLVGFVKAWEEQDRLYIQTELCEMSLSDYSDRVARIPESQVWGFLKDLVMALGHIHSHQMIHADIKPENVFLDSKMVCKLGDFGLAINLKNRADVQEAEEGDSRYLAPEVLNGSPTMEADVFSLGITILEVATDLHVPSGGSAWQAIRDGNIPERFFNRISKELRKVISGMIEKSPEKRPTAQQLQTQLFS